MGVTYDIEDILLLINLVEERRDVIESKATQTDLELAGEKVLAWNEILRLFNETATSRRSMSALKERWGELKKTARERLRNKNKELWKTGGGVPSTDVYIEEHFMKVLDVIAPTLKRTYSEWDSDKDHIENKRPAEPVPSNEQQNEELTLQRKMLEVLEEEKNRVKMIYRQLKDGYAVVPELLEEFGGPWKPLALQDYAQKSLLRATHRSDNKLVARRRLNRLTEEYLRKKTLLKRRQIKFFLLKQDMKSKIGSLEEVLNKL